MHDPCTVLPCPEHRCFGGNRCLGRRGKQAATPPNLAKGAAALQGNFDVPPFKKGSGATLRHTQKGLAAKVTLRFEIGR